MSREPERVDLSPLDPTLDQLSYERLVRRIVAAAGPELARRAREAGPLTFVAGWARPTLAAAAIIVLVALGSLFAIDPAGVDGDETRTLEALGIPAPAAEWLEDGREPTTADLVLAVETRR
jgi:hypothetical protein